MTNRGKTCLRATHRQMGNRVGLLAAVLMFTLVPAALSAGVDTAWVRRYDGPAHLSDYAICLAVDNQGNVIITGASQGVDSTYDWVTIKYSSTGDSLWADRRSYGGGKPVSLEVDSSGSVYVGGNGNGRLATVKYSPTGQVLWALPYGPQDSVDMAGLAFDVDGNLMLGGSLRQASWDALLVKYRPSGDTVWARTYDVDGHVNGGDAIACDFEGGTYVAGSYLDDAPRENCVMFRVDSLGNRLWITLFADSARESWLDNVMLDRDGNAVAIGKYIGTTTNYDYLTIKYDYAGETLWTRRFNGTANGDDKAQAVAVDGWGYCYVTGYARYTDTDDDFATIAYRPDGSVAWLARYDGPAHSGDGAYAIAVDESRRVFVTGNSYTPQTKADCATVCYDSLGDTIWVRRYNSPANWAEYTTALSLGPDGVVCVAGIGYTAGGTSSDMLTIKYVQNGGVAECTRPCVTAFALDARPNPFVDRTSVSFGLPCNGVAFARVLDMSGRVVRTLCRGSLAAGQHSVVWDRTDDQGARVPQGVYMLVLDADGARARVKVTVLK
ncbi:MAG: hypothetical protein NTX53_21125 [candidate division WOR-3 bacterium]|nr:hypothetical protein [candidate division WOR-3 bacterium]